METKEIETKEIVEQLAGIQNQLKGVKRRGVTKIFSIILALIVGVVGGIFCGLNWDAIMMKINPNEYAKSTITVLDSKLEKQATLNTGLYTQTAHYDSGKLQKNIAVFKKITTKSFSFDYTGYVEAGIKDLSKAEVEVNSATNVITIKMPAIEITNVHVNVDSLTNTDQTKNIFSQITIEDFVKAQADMENNLKTQALNGDIISTAQESAEETIRKLFDGLIEGYNLEFAWE